MKTSFGTLVVLLTFSFAGFSPATAHTDNQPSDSSDSVAALIDSAELESAIETFETGDAESAAELATIVAPQNGVDLDESSLVDLNSDGELVLNADAGFTMGLSVKGSNSTPEIIDGTAVTTAVDTDLDVVARATNDGAQLLTVLGSKHAPNSIEFELDLPNDATLTQQPDGSIWINTDSFGAEIKTPWAIDADGNPINTRYEINGRTLVQVIETNTNTAFPVVADPAWAPILALAAKQCAKGALAGVAATALVDFVKGKKSKKSDYILNAAASCIVAAGGVSVGIAMKSAKVRKWAATQLVKIVLTLRR